MSQIQIMDENLANKIAAGEVVEKTMNVVKELVENSIDAMSNEIKIELIDSGVKEIKVSDDGCGMSKEDALLAFSRHATSKLKRLDDLFHIQSLGFRGEALPSIASVSYVTLKTSDGIEGTLLHLDGGKLIDVNSSDLKKGTSITVNNLFYNTPVRLKYLKNLYVELANITEYVNKMALSYPHIKFYLSNNDKVLLNTPGDGDLLRVIHDIYGLEVAKKMAKIEGENDDYEISGYIGYPEMARSTRNHITTLVNGRVIRNNDLNRMITDSYHTYIPSEKFPIVVLNITVDPILVDVNVHPTKMDIKFSKMAELKQLLQTLISDKLEHLLLIPTAAVREENAIPHIERPVFSYSEPTDQMNHENVEEESFQFTIQDVELEGTSRMKAMHPVGLVHGTYIVAENEDGMFLIDQHAAAERINYEKCLHAMLSKEPSIEQMVVPISIELPVSEYLIVQKHFDLLEKLGFEVEEFGGNSLLIRSQPTWLPKGNEKAAIQKIMEIISTTEDFDYAKFIDHTAATMACKMSIKANDVISLEDMEYLLETLRKCDNPFTCPHGRPTIITYTNYELEKLFKRAMN